VRNTRKSGAFHALRRQAASKGLVERIAMKRLGAPQDIANSVVFFASELAGFVNGQVLAVDGGK
jgi:3-oxoacyl-[acyl-carrier protein] reductase